MAKYRGKKQHRLAHPKIFVWSHTKKAEIEYFQDFKNYLKTPLLMPKKEICWKPQELLEYVVNWKQNSANINEKDHDQVWCIFDIDDFYKNDNDGFLKAIKYARENNVKIAYANECFELWVLLHFQKVLSPIHRGKDVEAKIQKAFKKNGLKHFQKNQKVFDVLLPFQEQALKNAKSLLPMSYEKINWGNALSNKGNPSTSIHLLVGEIIKFKDIQILP